MSSILVRVEQSIPFRNSINLMVPSIGSVISQWKFWMNSIVCANNQRRFSSLRCGLTRSLFFVSLFCSVYTERPEHSIPSNFILILNEIVCFVGFFAFNNNLFAVVSSYSPCLLCVNKNEQFVNSNYGLIGSDELHSAHADMNFAKKKTSLYSWLK